MTDKNMKRLSIQLQPEKCPDLVELWSRIRSRFFECEDIGPALVKASVVICEGEQGWDDYLLLRHYDNTQKLDTI